ncbi:hypothetical protein SK128_019189 [Halocaridina rubra]|uniref:Transmembrane protein 245 n=1 Tax=Halocaridina rubra TaxID=373956 RepID=A0AAN8XGP0_HALRR
MALYGDSVRSPLEQVWRQFVPQGYDQALRNAFYNVAAVVFVVCVSAAAWSVYMIFQPFVKPLLWAVLCGSLLHPAKYMVTSWTRGWLQEVHSAGSLLSVSLTVLPLRLLDTISEVLGRFVVKHVRSVVTVTVILPVVYIIIHHTPAFLSSLAYVTVSNLFYVFSAIVSFVGSNGYVVLTLVLGYAIAVMFFWSNNTSQMLTKMSLGIWLIAAAGLSGLWPAGSVPIFIILCLLLLAGLFTEVLDVQAALRATKGEEVSILEASLVVCLGNSSEISESLPSQEQICEPSDKSISLSPVREEEEIGHQDSCHFPKISPSSVSDKMDENILSKSTTAEAGENEQILKPTIIAEGSTLDFNKEEEKDKFVSSVSQESTPRPQALLSASSPPRTQLQSARSSKEENDNSSNIYLKAVLVACVLVELWRHNYLLPLLPLAMLYYLIKKLASKYLAWGLKSGSTVSSVANTAKDNIVAWADERRAALLPPPMKGVLKLLIRTDRHMITAFSSAVDAVVTLLIILGVIVFAVTASIFLAVQVSLTDILLL